MRIAPTSQWGKPGLRIKNYELKERGTVGCGVASGQALQGIQDLFLVSSFSREEDLGYIPPGLKLNLYPNRLDEGANFLFQQQCEG